MSDDDFEAFWRKFLADHPSAANRWMHVAALISGGSGLAWSLLRRSWRPAVVGLGIGGLLAVIGHPLFQGDRPKNFGDPIWAARAFLRLCIRTITGELERELDPLRSEPTAAAPPPT